MYYYIISRKTDHTDREYLCADIENLTYDWTLNPRHAFPIYARHIAERTLANLEHRFRGWNLTIEEVADP